jgi:hypothetical protein
LSELFQLGQVSHCQTDHHGRRGAEPPPGVDRGTPRSVAMVRSPVRWTSSRSRWS